MFTIGSVVRIRTGEPVQIKTDSLKEGQVLNRNNVHLTRRHGCLTGAFFYGPDFYMLNAGKEDVLKLCNPYPFRINVRVRNVQGAQEGALLS